MSKQMYRIIGDHRFYSDDKIRFYHGTVEGVTARIEELNATERDKAMDDKLKSLEWNIAYVSDLERFIEFYKGFSAELKRLLGAVESVANVADLEDRLFFAKQSVQEVRDEELKVERTWRFELLDSSEFEIEEE